MAKKPQHKRSVRAAYGRLWRDWLSNHRGALGISLILMLITAVSAAGYAKFMEIAIAGLERGSETIVYWGPAGIVGLVVAKALSQYAYLIMQNRVFSRVQADMQSQMFQSLLSMDLSHLLNESPAALATRFSADIELIRLAMREVFTSVTAILTIIATFIVMISIDWGMTIGLIGIFLLAFGPVGVVGSRVRKIAAATQDEIAGMTGSVNEGLGAIRMIRTYRLEKRMEGNANAVFERLFGLRVKLEKWRASVSPVMEILGGISIGLLILLVALRMRSGAIDVAGFIGLLTALGVATNPARKLGASYATALQGMAALDRVYELYDIPRQITDGSFEPKAHQKTKGSLHFKDVGFRYPDGYQALSGINLKIEPGKTVAFVGRSGAGKSTIFNLLPRLFDVSDGQITLDGKDLRDYTLASLRDQISVVSQDSILLSDTVYENIRFGRTDANEAEVEAAAVAAAAHEFIVELPQGYATMIEPSKARFSGGEKQRLSIARAILRDSPILLLDEPTSALDAESETAIKKALETLSEGRTTLIIAHRLATVMDADQIVVMDQGQIAEIGTHDELLEKEGIYKELYDLQFDLSPENGAPKPSAFRRSDKEWRDTTMGKIANFLGF